MMRDLFERKRVHQVFIYRIGERRIAQFVRRYNLNKPGGSYVFYELTKERLEKLIADLEEAGTMIRERNTYPDGWLLAERAQ